MGAPGLHIHFPRTPDPDQLAETGACCWLDCLFPRALVGAGGSLPRDLREHVSLVVGFDRDPGPCAVVRSARGIVSWLKFACDRVAFATLKCRFERI